MHCNFPQTLASPRQHLQCVLAHITCVLLMMLSLQVSAQGSDDDPWEGMNRAVFEFNDAADQFVLKPVAKGYDAIMPAPARKGVDNFFNNLWDANGAINALLQGRIAEALDNSARVLVNSTIGVLGLFDVASAGGIPRYKTDFGHTLAAWGVGRGPYVVIPLAGPRTLRSATGSLVDAYGSVQAQLDTDAAIGLWGLELLDLRADLLSAEELISGDRYIFIRDVYLQQRAQQVGEATNRDDFSEFDDWEEDPL